jgi:hypothetical protein
VNHNETFFSIAVPVPVKFRSDPGYKIEEWGVEHPPIVEVLRDKQPLENPNDFSQDDVLYSFHWPEKVVSPPNRWLERASELYELQMLLEFTDGDRITILECNKEGEVVLDKELERSAALEFFEIQARIEGGVKHSPLYLADAIRNSIKTYRDSFKHSVPTFLLADLLYTTLTEEELRATLHLYTAKVQEKARAERDRLWKERDEEIRKTPQGALTAKKNEAFHSFVTNLDAAKAKGPAAVAQFHADHMNLMASTIEGPFDISKMRRFVRDLWKHHPDVREHFTQIKLETDERTALFLKELKIAQKNQRDSDLKAQKRDAKRKAILQRSIDDLKAEKAKAQPIVQPLNLFDFNTPAININDLISDEAKSLKGDK